MLAATDPVALITAVASLIGSMAALVAAFYGRGAKGRANDAATSSAALTTAVSEVHAAVSTPPDTAPLGQVVAEGARDIDAIREAVNGKH